MIGKLKSAKEIFKNSNNEMTYDVDFVNYIMENENKEINITKDTDDYYLLTDLNFLLIKDDFEYIKEDSSKIKSIGYECNDYKLGQTVIFKGRKENIVGFDENCGIHYSFILITDSSSIGDSFEYNKHMLTSYLDTSPEQSTLWIRHYEIEKEETPQVDIKDNECNVKPKLPKYVKITNEGQSTYKVGNVYKAKYIENCNMYGITDKKCNIVIGYIDSSDCIPIDKKDLMVVGSKVKLKKKYYNVIDKKEINNFKGKIVTIKNIYEDEHGKWYDFEENNLFGWKQHMFKPYLDI